MNNGDALPIILDYTVNDVPLEEYGVDEIEVYFGDNRYLLSKGEITIDEETGKYCFFLSQLQSFRLPNMYAEYQVRIKKGNEVASMNIDKVYIGRSISREEI